MDSSRCGIDKFKTGTRIKVKIMFGASGCASHTDKRCEWLRRAATRVKMEREVKVGSRRNPTHGMSEQEILDDYPELEAEDFRAVYDFAPRWAGASRCEVAL